MKKLNKDRAGCKDVFRAFLLQGVDFAGKYDLPVIKEEHVIPRKCIRFSESIREKKDFHQWVVFYEDDFQFERIWNNPKKYIDILKKYDGVITPDFSLYYDMPLAMQIWNIYRSRAIGAWLQKSGIRVVPNIRFGSSETYDIVCDGISKHSVISVGTLGCIKRLNYRDEFENALLKIALKLEPETIIVYGSLPGNVKKIKQLGINVVSFQPDYSHFQEGVR